MAITRTSLNQSQSTTNSATYDTGSIAPSANQFVILTLRSLHSTAGTPTCTVTSNSGLNLTWAQIVRTDFSTIASPTNDVIMFGALTTASPGSGTVHVAFSGTGSTQSGLIWDIAEYDGCDISGGTVASVIQQTGSGSSDTAGTTWTDTFGSAVNTNNAVVAVGGNANKNAPGGTWNSSFTQDTNVGSTESTAYNMGDGHVLSGFTGSSHTITSTTASAAWGIAGAELKVAASGSVVTDTDSATLTDSLNALNAADVATEAGTLSESVGTIPVVASTSDSGALSESPTGNLTLAAVSDSGTLSENASASLTQIAAGSETITTTETVSSISIAVTISDTGTLTESAVATLTISPTDSVTVTEAAGIVVAGTTADSAAVGESLAENAAVGGTDSAVLSESASASQAAGTNAITDTDNFAVQEAINSLIASLSDTEAFAMAEAASVPQPPAPPGPDEIGIPVRYLGKKWYQTIPPKAYWTPGSR